MEKLKFIETRFKCYREMGAIKNYLRDLRKESKEYNELLYIMKNFSKEERQSIFNKLKINKANNIESNDFLSRYREFEQFEWDGNEDIYNSFNECEKYIDKENRYIKMHLIYMYTILDECLLELLNVLEITPSGLSGVLSKLDAILKSPKIKTQIDEETYKEIFVFARVRNDIIHNNGKVSEITVQQAEKKTYINYSELKNVFNLFKDEEINLKIDDLKRYSDISNETLEKLYISFMENN